MKFIFMLLIPFVLIDPVLAKPIYNTSQCLGMYHTYMNEYGTSRLIPDPQMRNFIGRCLPDDSAHNTATEPTYIDGSQRQKLFHTDSKNKIVSIKM